MSQNELFLEAVRLRELLKGEIKKTTMVLDFCRTHIDQEWASAIVGIVLNCDFKIAQLALKAYDERLERERIRNEQRLNPQGISETS